MKRPKKPKSPKKIKNELEERTFIELSITDCIDNDHELYKKFLFDYDFKRRVLAQVNKKRRNNWKGSKVDYVKLHRAFSIKN